MNRPSIALVALAVAGASNGASAQSAAGTFCARMAAHLDMKPVKPGTSGKAVYEARALKGLGKTLFGGSTMVSMMLKPPAGGDIGDPGRYATACRAAGGRLACDVTGPALFEISVDKASASVEARSGEAAEVSMAKNRVRCEDR